MKHEINETMKPRKKKIIIISEFELGKIENESIYVGLKTWLVFQ